MFSYEGFQDLLGQQTGALASGDIGNLTITQALDLQYLAADQNLVLDSNGVVVGEPRDSFTNNTNIEWTQSAGRVFEAKLPQDITPTSNPTFASVNTGQGHNSLYPMDQAVLQDSKVNFAEVFIGEEVIPYEFDSNTGTDVTLSNGMLTATHASSSAISGAYTTQTFLGSATVQAEFTVDAVSGSNLVIGLASDDYSDPDTLPSTAATYILWNWSIGRLTFNYVDANWASPANTIYGPPSVGNRCKIIVDANQIRVYVDEGSGYVNVLGEAPEIPLYGFSTTTSYRLVVFDSNASVGGWTVSMLAHEDLIPPIDLGDLTVDGTSILYDSVYLPSLTPSQPLALDSNGAIISQAATSTSIVGTANQITVNEAPTDTFTLSTPQDIATTSDLVFNSVLVGEGTAALPSLAVATTGSQDMGFYNAGSHTLGLSLQNDPTYIWSPQEFSPAEDKKQDLGDPDAVWRNTYTDDIYVQGPPTNSVTYLSSASRLTGVQLPVGHALIGNGVGVAPSSQHVGGHIDLTSTDESIDVVDNGDGDFDIKVDPSIRYDTVGSKWDPHQIGPAMVVGRGGRVLVGETSTLKRRAYCQNEFTVPAPSAATTNLRLGFRVTYSNKNVVIGFAPPGLSLDNPGGEAGAYTVTLHTGFIIANGVGWGSMVTSPADGDLVEIEINSSDSKWSIYLNGILDTADITVVASDTYMPQVYDSSVESSTFTIELEPQIIGPIKTQLFEWTGIEFASLTRTSQFTSNAAFDPSGNLVLTPQGPQSSITTAGFTNTNWVLDYTGANGFFEVHLDFLAERKTLVTGRIVQLLIKKNGVTQAFGQITSDPEEFGSSLTKITSLVSGDQLTFELANGVSAATIRPRVMCVTVKMLSNI